MFLKAKPTLQEQIVVLLAEEANLSALMLRARLHSKFRAVSIQAIYQELRLLQSRGAVVKAGEAYSLSLSWVLRMIAFGDTLGRNYIRGRAAAITLPEDGNDKVWHFTSLRRLENFWMHLLLVLIEKSDHPTLYQWSPRPWYYLVQQQRQFDFQEQAEKLGAQVFKALGGRGFLDREFMAHHRPSLYTLSSAKSPFESRRSMYISVIDSFVLRVHLDVRTTKKIDDYFSKIKSDQDLSIPEILQLMARPVSVSVRLRRDSVQARSLRRQFKVLFRLPSTKDAASSKRK